jgi:hypothetical protein
MADKAGMLLLALSVREHKRLHAIFPCSQFVRRSPRLGLRKKRKALSPPAIAGRFEKEPDERNGRTY